ncbi:MAG TPA: DUF1592 domain-containing protein [Polyangiaceae bacterium]|nr:DUF1592 domain-containing protein [Polyangiaceae bacterium]
MIAARLPFLRWARYWACAAPLCLASCVGEVASSGADGAGAQPGGPGAGTGASAGSGVAGGGGQLLDCTQASVAEAPLRRLTREQFDNTLRDLLGTTDKPSLRIAHDEKVAAFYSNAIAPVNRLAVEQFVDVAEDLATAATADAPSFADCQAGEDEAACAERFIREFGLRVYRRPLDATESERYGALFDEYAATSFADGIRRVVATMLQSPHFLYHLDVAQAVGESGVAALDGYQLASRLSYALWQTMPDADLFAAAAAGELASAEGLRAQAERLLGDDRARDAIASFHVQWLGLDAILDLDKDAALFPEFDGAFAAAMRGETVRFADYVIRQGDGRLETLLSAPYSFPEGPLLALYGASPAANPAEPVMLDPSQRAGLLTQAAFLATHAHGNQTSPVRRGVAVRKHLLCTELPDPPANVDNTPPDPDPNATTRERFSAHSADPACAGCHQLIDPIGLGFENYDALGRFRTEENGAAIDASGDLTQAGDSSGPYNGAVELAHKLATSPEVRSCVSKQWFRFALGRIERDEDACSVQRLGQDFSATDYDVRALLLSLVTSDAFRYRKAAP